MNFLELQNAALGDSFDATKYRDRVKRYLNDAAGRIARRVKSPGSVRTVELPVTAGAGIVSMSTIAASFIRVENVLFVGADGRSMSVDPVTIDEIDELDAVDALFTSSPDVYAVSHDTELGLAVRPLPDQDGLLRVRYVSRPERLVTDGDTPDLHDDYQDMLVTYARAKCFREEDDKEMHDALMVDFEGDLARLRVDIQNEQEDGPKVVEGCW